jgi:hypothetical protein
MKSNFLKTASIFLMLLSFASHAWSQSLSDAIMMNGRQACVLLDYNFSSFDHYWEGEMKRENQTIATLQRQTFMPMVAVGIIDDLNLFVGVPRVSTQSTNPNGGKFKGASGFQDITVALKYRWLDRRFKTGALTGLATFGFSTPVTNYLPDYMPYSIGLGAPEFSYRGIIQYEANSAWYVRTAPAYLWRGYAEAEREYYYNNGSYYTPWMDVPSAFTVEAVVGKWFFNRSLQVELSYFGQRSFSGDDIRTYAAPQPTNKVNLDKAGLFVHYFVPKVEGLGVVAYYQRVLDGRNAPEMNTVGGGLTYFFNYLKPSKNEK